MSERPMVNVYEVDEDGDEVPVYREMNDDEYAQWQADVAAYEEAQAAEAARLHPLVEWVQTMTDEDKAALLKLLG